jgi:hypothetical protein
VIKQINQNIQNSPTPKSTGTISTIISKIKITKIHMHQE